ncbi:hypothetical protein Mal48_39740 [Thalassoglobus polymorphus]|uniref:Uncharacterized protein n=1 Tax=Thalassoglobus polymorphus TaxID=2527994 RepID=A0A517QSV1_9PLAN|nr:hypothetical protein Mal48_39740 [Thalassoglobus polymorphus]
MWLGQSQYWSERPASLRVVHGIVKLAFKGEANYE